MSDELISSYSYGPLMSTYNYGPALTSLEVPEMPERISFRGPSIEAYHRGKSVANHLGRHLAVQTGMHQTVLGPSVHEAVARAATTAAPTVGGRIDVSG